MMPAFLREIISSRYLAFLLRVFLGSFFLYASMSKIPYPAQFAEAVANYRLVPYSLLNLGAVILPWVEFVCGLFLIIGFMSRACTILIGLMLIMFNVMVLINMYWGAPITCGCYDTVGEPIGWRKITENFILLIFAVQIYFFDRFLVFRRDRLTYGTRIKVASPGLR
jgi:putative oxidoreductase